MTFIGERRIRLSRLVAVCAAAGLGYWVYAYGGETLFILALLVKDLQSTQPIRSATSADGSQIAEICWSNNGGDGAYTLVVREPDGVPCFSGAKLDLPPVETELQWLSPSTLEVLFTADLPEREKPTRNQLAGVNLIFGSRHSQPR